jgi:hypothetical protein
LHAQTIRAHVLNPKCIKMGELYGEYNLLTNEWTDGLVGRTLRPAQNMRGPLTCCGKKRTAMCAAVMGLLDCLRGADLRPCRRAR